MYKEFFGLMEKPFGNTPDPRFLYACRQYREALARLSYAVEEREFAVLTGAIGSGKTTLSRTLMDEFDDTFKFHLMINPRLTPTQFLRNVAGSMGLKPRYFKNDLLEQIHGRLYHYYEEGISYVLVVDEAQLIPRKTTFDEIRLLTNFQLDDVNLITILLLGQPELDRRLKHPSYEPLRQRVAMRFNLNPLDLIDTVGYISHRLEVAGSKNNPFSDDAVEKIHACSGGIPRVINTLSTTALLAAYGREAKIITTEIVEEAAAEFAGGFYNG